MDTKLLPREREERDTVAKITCERFLKHTHQEVRVLLSGVPIWSPRTSMSKSRIYPGERGEAQEWGLLTKS